LYGVDDFGFNQSHIPLSMQDWNKHNAVGCLVFVLLVLQFAVSKKFALRRLRLGF
jgi:hypothetical protein